MSDEPMTNPIRKALEDVSEMVMYKLTRRDLTTHDRFLWVPGKWYEIAADKRTGKLCSTGFFHCYESPEIASLMNSVGANYTDSLLWRCEVDGDGLDDRGLKAGFTRMRIVEQVPMPDYTTTQRVAFGILCALGVNDDAGFVAWAEKWLSGEDRSQEVARREQHSRAAAVWAAWAAAAERAAAWAAWEAAAANNNNVWPLYLQLCAEMARDFHD